jgi:hypothetical protein
VSVARNIGDGVGQQGDRKSAAADSSGSVGAAADLLEDFIEEVPDNQEALLLIGQAYQVIGQENLAKSFLARSVAAKDSETLSQDTNQFGTEDFRRLRALAARKLIPESIQWVSAAWLIDQAN